jgi:protein-S-isoprenylcysteine O-methyltransferase Ste14
MQNVATFTDPAVRLGRWWFQNRSLSPVPFFLLMAFLPSNFTPTPAALAALVGVVFLAEALRVWAVGYAGSVTRTRSDSVGTLVHSGPYRWVRNPLYVANIAMYTACCVAFGFTTLSGILFLYSCIQYTFIVRYEEQVLGTTFGDAYDMFRQEVPRWAAFSKPAYPSSGHIFDLKKALRSERTTLYLLALLFVTLTLKRLYFS